MKNFTLMLFALLITVYSFASESTVFEGGNVFSKRADSIINFSTVKKDSAYYLKKGRTGVALVSVSQALNLISSIMIGVGGYYAISFNAQYPYLQNDITTNPQYFVPLYIGILGVITSGPLFFVGLPFLIYGYFKYNQIKKGKRVSLLLRSSELDEFDIGLSIKI